MAPDRGTEDSTLRSSHRDPDHGDNDYEPEISDEIIPDPHTHSQSLSRSNSRNDAARLLADRASAPQNFTLRSTLLGLLIGIVIVFSNTYFGLQTGWISGMSMPSVLIGFAVFRALGPYLKMPFSPVENVLIQTVAGSTGTMPLGCGFVGVIPALEYLLKPEENGPLEISLAQLCLWAGGICLFGVVFAIPLRKEVIIREKLKFPSGTATALMIGVLHGGSQEASVVKQEDHQDANTRPGDEGEEEDETQALMGHTEPEEPLDRRVSATAGVSHAEMLPDFLCNPAAGGSAEWKAQIRLLILAFAGSAAYTLLSYFIPQLRNIPIFGMPLARDWLWTLNPSPAYVGQGIIMGPATTAHMLFGAILGWAVLSPLAKHQGWAPGPIGDWSNGSKGWIIWVSLAIMLADALIGLGWLVMRPLIYYSRIYGPTVYTHIRRGDWKDLKDILGGSPSHKGYTPVHEFASSSSTALDSTDSNNTNNTTLKHRHRKQPTSPEDEPEVDAPPEHLVSPRSFTFWAVLSVVVYFVSIHFAFPGLLPFSLTLLALVLALFLSILGVRALGETDLNPVSGISKLTQLFFALAVSSSSATGSTNAITANLLAGAISESAALQAGDLLQDLKTGHLLGASPAAQFYGQVIGSLVGAVASAAVYRLYTSVYTIPSKQFQVPTAFVWVFTARLVTGQGLPPMAAVFAGAAAAIWAVVTALRIAARARRSPEWIVNALPGGIAVAVGMYNTPSFTLARAVGGLIAWWWTRRRGGDQSAVIVLASGLILGEGLFSIVNLGLASAGVPHLGQS